MEHLGILAITFFLMLIGFIFGALIALGLFLQYLASAAEAALKGFNDGKLKK